MLFRELENSHPDPLYTEGEPAQTPHKSVLMMMLWFLKWLATSHPVSGKSASAEPQVLGLGFWLVMSLGIALRANCHMRIPSVRHSTAMTPPPWLLKAGP